MLKIIQAHFTKALPCSIWGGLASPQDLLASTVKNKNSVAHTDPTEALWIPEEAGFVSFWLITAVSNKRSLMMDFGTTCPTLPVAGPMIPRIKIR
jgi:hypothetical protein